MYDCKLKGIGIIQHYSLASRALDGKIYTSYNLYLSYLYAKFKLQPEMVSLA